MSKAIVTVPGIQQSFYADQIPEDGIVARFLFDSPAHIISASVWIEEMGNMARVEVDVKHFSGGVTSTVSFNVNKNGGKAPINRPIKEGDRISVKIPTGLDLSRVWITCTYKPIVTRSMAVTVVAEELGQ